MMNNTMPIKQYRAIFYAVTLAVSLSKTVGISAQSDGPAEAIETIETIDVPNGETTSEDTSTTPEAASASEAATEAVVEPPAPVDATNKNTTNQEVPVPAEDSAGGEHWRMNVITDPAISARCDELDRDRNDKIEVKQRLMALIRRGEKARKKTPNEKKSIARKLVDTDVKLKNELELTRMKIEALEEHIIRQGCPGIRL